MPRPDDDHHEQQEPLNSTQRQTSNNEGYHTDPEPAVRIVPPSPAPEPLSRGETETYFSRSQPSARRLSTHHEEADERTHLQADTDCNDDDDDDDDDNDNSNNNKNNNNKNNMSHAQNNGAGAYWRPQINQQPLVRVATPGADNFGAAASGGLTGLAYNVADGPSRHDQYHHSQPQHQQHFDPGYGDEQQQPTYNHGASHLENPEPAYLSREENVHPDPTYHGYNGYADATLRANSPYLDQHQYQQQQQQHYASNTPAQLAPALTPYGPGRNQGYRDSATSVTLLGSGGALPGQATPVRNTPSPYDSSYGTPVADEHVYANYRYEPPGMGQVQPHEILDDGDDGLEWRPPGVTASILSLKKVGRGSKNASGAAGAAATAASAAAATGSVAATAAYTRMASGSNPTTTEATATAPAPAGENSAAELGYAGAPPVLEKPSEWLKKQNKGRRRWRWLILAVIIIALVCALVFGVILPLKNRAAGGISAGDDAAKNGDLNANSAEIKKLLGNPNLKKVFTAMDYTPYNTQYPDCAKWPPSQNNVTRDIAVLSQLTNTVRLYGTDCNQTQMVLHAIDRLQLKGKMKVWMGVWQDGNKTTNARQLSQMWDVFDQYGSSDFLGVIVANEILFRKEMSISDLSTLLSDVRDKLNQRGMKNLHVATSDLGDNWTAELASISDAIMGNIHPFFAGVDVSEASQWTTTFWNNHIGKFKKSDASLNIISETGWPSGGGTRKSSVAGVSELNRFMEDWVCRALKEKINYFWFEAFDEPWKVRYNTGDEQWEDKWGMLSVDRVLKKGIVIPDCGGMRVPDL